MTINKNTTVIAITSLFVFLATYSGPSVTWRQLYVGLDKKLSFTIMWFDRDVGGSFSINFRNAMPKSIDFMPSVYRMNIQMPGIKGGWFSLPLWPVLAIAICYMLYAILRHGKTVKYINTACAECGYPRASGNNCPECGKPYAAPSSAD